MKKEDGGGDTSYPMVEKQSRVPVEDGVICASERLKPLNNEAALDWKAPDVCTGGRDEAEDIRGASPALHHHQRPEPFPLEVESGEGSGPNESRRVKSRSHGCSQLSDPTWHYSQAKAQRTLLWKKLYSYEEKTYSWYQYLGSYKQTKQKLRLTTCPPVDKAPNLPWSFQWALRNTSNMKDQIHKLK